MKKLEKQEAKLRVSPVKIKHDNVRQIESLKCIGQDREACTKRFVRGFKAVGSVQEAGTKTDSIQSDLCAQA